MHDGNAAIRRHIPRKFCSTAAIGLVAALLICRPSDARAPEEAPVCVSFFGASFGAADPTSEVDPVFAAAGQLLAEASRLSDAELEVRLSLWAAGRVQAHGYLNGLRNSPDEPRTFSELAQASQSTETGAFKQVYSNVLGSVVSVLGHAPSRARRSQGGRVDPAFFELLQTAVLFHEFASRWSRSRPMPGNMRRAYQMTEEAFASAR